jgi:hypothetical protein
VAGFFGVIKALEMLSGIYGRLGERGQVISPVTGDPPHATSHKLRFARDLWKRKRITKKAQAGHGQETTGEIPIYSIFIAKLTGKT